VTWLDTQAIVSNASDTLGDFEMEVTLDSTCCALTLPITGTVKVCALALTTPKQVHVLIALHQAYTQSMVVWFRAS
jgi:hypothetical protein